MVPVTSERETALAKKKKKRKKTWRKRHAIAAQYSRDDRFTEIRPQRPTLLYPLSADERSDRSRAVPVPVPLPLPPIGTTRLRVRWRCLHRVGRVIGSGRQQGPSKRRQEHGSAGRGRSAWANTRHVGVTCEPSAM